MSSPKTMRWVAATILIGVFASACGTSSTAPSPPPPPPATHPTVAIASITTTGSRTGGYQYKTVVQLKESNGANATIAAVDLTFMAGTTQLAASHFDRPISDTANVCPASSTISTRELVTTDPDPSHAYAVAVRASVTFGDATGYSATAVGSAEVPPIVPVTPQTYSISGTITDAATRTGIAGARVEALNGANVGKAATTDSRGGYTIDGLVAETFRMRASASGYGTGEQNVTVPANPRADFELQPLAQAPCSYTVTPGGPISVGFGAGTSSLAIARTSGSCAWRASASVGWITLGTSSGGADATLPFTYKDNPTFVGRVGTISVAWDGGSVDVLVSQSNSPPICVASLTVGGDNPFAVPAAGGQYVATVKLPDGVPGFVCGSWTASATPASQIAIVGLDYGPGVPSGLTFFVQPNATHAARSLFVTIQFANNGAAATLTVNQAATP